jgi:Peptidase M66
VKTGYLQFDPIGNGEGNACFFIRSSQTLPVQSAWILYGVDMFKTVALSLIASVLLGACNGATQKPVSTPDDTPNGITGDLPVAVINKLELAQTHVIPPEGKSWTGQKFAPYNLHLVGNREALVLLDFDSVAVKDPMLEVFVAGQKVGQVALNASSSLPPTEANGAAYSGTAFWVKLERAWVRPGLSLSLRGSNTALSVARAVRVGAPSEFSMLTLPFYLFGLNETVLPLSRTATADQATRDEYFAKHPFASLSIKNHAAQKIVWPYIVVGPRQGRAAQKVGYAEQQGDAYATMSAVLDTLNAMREANGDGPINRQYYAPLLMANQAGKYSSPGGGLGGNHAGTGDYDYSGIFIHEAGHAFGMPHANDGFLNGTFPYVGGSLKGSAWGFDQNKNRFLAPFVPSTAQTFKNCATSSFPMGRQLDDQNRCIKQDSMQSGAGDQALGDKYTMFSDFNASVVQQYLEGSTSIKDGKHEYAGGRVMPDPASSTGYSRWDSIDSNFVPVPRTTVLKGLYGLDGGLPITRDVPVRTIIMTVNIDGITDSNGDGKLGYADTIKYNAATTQIYDPVTFTGNLRRLIDPTDATQRASIVPDTGENPWFCKNAGCDYSLKVTFADSTEQFVVLQKGFRGWFDANIPAEAANPISGSSYRVWGVNISAAKAIQKLEVLETPEVWKGLPALPKVVASRMVN